MRLSERVAFITGSGNGIGRGVALAMARDGADVALCDLDEDGLAESKRQAREAGAEVLTRSLDVRDTDTAEAFVNETAEHFGRLDILVNVAGIMPVVPNAEVAESTVDEVLSVNLKAAIMFTKFAIPHLRAAGGGSVIHTASVTGHNGHPGVVAYGATKGGLMALARGQAMELAEYDIRVNTVSPGTVDSPMLHRFLEENANDVESARAGFNRIHPRGTVASIEEVADVFAFLASDEAANITATDVRCDGGFCVQAQQPRS